MLQNFTSLESNNLSRISSINNYSDDKNYPAQNMEIEIKNNDEASLVNLNNASQSQKSPSCGASDLISSTILSSPEIRSCDTSLLGHQSSNSSLLSMSSTMASSSPHNIISSTTDVNNLSSAASQSSGRDSSSPSVEYDCDPAVARRDKLSVKNTKVLRSKNKTIRIKKINMPPASARKKEIRSSKRARFTDETIKNSKQVDADNKKSYNEDNSMNSSDSTISHDSTDSPRSSTNVFSHGGNKIPRSNCSISIPIAEKSSECKPVSCSQVIVFNQPPSQVLTTFGSNKTHEEHLNYHIDQPDQLNTTNDKNQMRHSNHNQIEAAPLNSNGLRNCAQEQHAQPYAGNSNYLTTRRTMKYSTGTHNQQLNVPKTSKTRYEKPSNTQTSPDHGSPSGRAETIPQKPLHPMLMNASVCLELKTLWNDFNELGTEMIVTKAGRYVTVDNCWVKRAGY